ncbi:hypothetical protein GCM10011390_42390 [Aureimonas endophytica]|uniref:TIGR02301 family protein n=1 Tax=Aureimonas endophytica TaxID=2027858 RepID=A0A917EAA3_9HYPH|nr:TIGR02301 family protein [Aureimonas endophytica]GGE18727.1 hypothetical protein GCM10011390_42390 [Aureimonas endophytica]
MHTLRHLLIGIIGASALFAGSALAEIPGKNGKAEAGAEAPAPAPAAPKAPFMKPMSRLASILGSVHFLRELCGDENAGIWRDRMNDLLAAQSPAPAERQQLIASFNSGYRAFASVYRRCTPAARMAVGRYQDEGVALSRDIAGRFGN